MLGLQSRSWLPRVVLVALMCGIACSAHEPTSPNASRGEALKLNDTVPTLVPNGAECNQPANAIVLENCITAQTFDPGVWDVDSTATPVLNADGTLQGATDFEEAGFTKRFSHNAGEPVEFKLRSAQPWTLDIFRLGFYQGHGARGLQQLTGAAAAQPGCVKLDTDHGIDCSDWQTTTSWPTAGLTPGVYVARMSVGGARKALIPFVIRNDARYAANPPKVVVQMADATWQAYNLWGENGNCSTYECEDPDAVVPAKVSYQRPYRSLANYATARSWHYNFFSDHYPLIRWLERNGYDVAYVSSQDTEYQPDLVRAAKVFVSAGHDEYWTKGMRATVRAARDAGTTGLVFLGGNSMFESARFEGPTHDWLVSYKDTRSFGVPRDLGPTGNAFTNPEPTAFNRDPRFLDAANGRVPENETMGLLFRTIAGDGTAQPITVSGNYGKLRQWRGTAVSGLAGSTRIYTSSTAASLGYEMDLDTDNGFRPAGLFHLTSTHLRNGYANELSSAWGGAGEARADMSDHHLTLYRAPSGAWVFAAGSIKFARTLDDVYDNNDFDPRPRVADPAIQQLMVNVLADMGVQPTHLQAGLTAPVPSTERVPPVSSFGVPGVANAIVSAASAQTLCGSSRDAEGAVAAVEVSTDNRATWHPAVLTDSGACGVEAAPPVGSRRWCYGWTPDRFGPTTIAVRAVDDSGNVETGPTRSVNVVASSGVFEKVTPRDPNVAASAPVELGLRFSSDVAGVVRGVRFYKGHDGSGAYPVHLWSPAGALLASGTVTLSASQTGWQDVLFTSPVSITAGARYAVSYAVNGKFTYQRYYFTPGHSLFANPLHEWGSAYSNTPNTFPTIVNPDNINYWADVIFSAQQGAAPVSSFYAAQAPSASSFYNPGAGATEVGTKFRVETDGVITGMRYYRDAANIGLHQGTLWREDIDNDTGNARDANGAVLSGTAHGLMRVRFADTGPAGWQEVTFPQPVSVTAGTILRTTVRTERGWHAAPVAGLPAPQMYNGSLRFISGLADLADRGFVRTEYPTHTFYVDPVFVPTAAKRNTLWDEESQPAFDAVQDVVNGTPSQYELGTSFKTESAGYVSAVRYFRGTNPTSDRSARLWLFNQSVPLATGYLTAPEAGWVEARFPAPVKVLADRLYVVSYYTPAPFAVTSGYFNETSLLGAHLPPLRAIGRTADGQNWEPGGGNGRASISIGTNPTLASNPVGPTGNNYWVEPVFATSLPSSASGLATACIGSVAGAACGTGGRCNENNECMLCGSWCRVARDCERGTVVCPTQTGAAPSCKAEATPRGTFCSMYDATIGANALPGQCDGAGACSTPFDANY